MLTYHICKIMFSKLSQRLHNYQKWNPLEYENLKVNEGYDSTYRTNTISYIDLTYEQYYISILWDFDALSILINDTFTDKINRFFIVPPVTINQEDIRFKSDKFTFEMDKDLIKTIEVIFKLKFYDLSVPYFETKNDILSQT